MGRGKTGSAPGRTGKMAEQGAEWAGKRLNLLTTINQLFMVMVEELFDYL